MEAARLTFEKGTLLIEGVPADADVTAIPGVFWDFEARGHRAPLAAFFAVAAELYAHDVPFFEGCSLDSDRASSIRPRGCVPGRPGKQAL